MNWTAFFHFLASFGSAGVIGLLLRIVYRYTTGVEARAKRDAQKARVDAEKAVEATARVNSANNERGNLWDHVNRLESRIDSGEKEVHALRIALDGAKDEHHECEKHREVLADKIVNLQTRIDGLEKSLAEANASLAEANAAIEQHRKQLAESRANRAEIAKRMDNLELSPPQT